MPRPPRVTAAVAAMPGAVYSPLGDRIAQRTGPVYPLHVGDTWRDPFDGGRMQDLTQAAHPGINRYTATRGITALVEGLGIPVFSAPPAISATKALSPGVA